MKLAQIQANFYVYMCTNASYFQKKLGDPIGTVLKIFEGFFLMLFILILLVGPILLFSTINPVGSVNFVTKGTL
jgi:hypothetical protein